MGLRKASAYSRKPVVPYTRTSKRKGKAYVKVVPASKIVKFTMGNEAWFKQGKLPYQLTVTSTEKIQVRDHALEACRQYMNKQLDKALLDKYLFKIIPYPHHIQRENKMLTGAGADRMSTGMQLSFGKSVGRSALMKPGRELFFFAVLNEAGVAMVRKVLREIRPKLPGRIKVDLKVVPAVTPAQ
ncbi:MAG TPA: 50S ribosomal protein L16 [Candidatus Pacearchaeota archaeon]|nr:50S ribosomal protein L16 [Candidatus Pacearchaeota archaeon]